jgi:uncharacterized membrane protein YbhN (UPF0104 family)
MRQWKSWVGFIISESIVYPAFRRIDMRLLLKNLREANYPYLVPIVAIIYLSVALRAGRWGYLLRSLKKIRQAEAKGAAE